MRAYHGPKDVPPGSVLSAHPGNAGAAPKSAPTGSVRGSELEIILGFIDPDNAAALRLIYGQQLTLAQAASVLPVLETSVKVRVATGMRQLTLHLLARPA